MFPRMVKIGETKVKIHKWAPFELSPFCHSKKKSAFNLKMNWGEREFQMATMPTFYK